MAEVFKTLLYLLGGLLVLPGALLAYFVWTLTGAIEQKNLFKLLFFLFDRFIDLIGWAFWIIIPSLLAWLVLAFVSKYRFCGAIPMAMLGFVSLIEILVVTKSNDYSFHSSSWSGCSSTSGLSGMPWVPSAGK